MTLASHARTMTRGERIFAVLVRAYPRAFRERHATELMAFFREDRRHPRYGSGPLRPVMFWAATVFDLTWVAAAERRPVLMRRFPALCFVLTLGLGIFSLVDGVVRRGLLVPDTHLAPGGPLPPDYQIYADCPAAELNPVFQEICARALVQDSEDWERGPLDRKTRRPAWNP